MSFQEPTDSTVSSLEKLDSNFRPNTSRLEDGVRWIDAREFTIEGQGWPLESRPFTRYPDRSHGVVRDDVWLLSRHCAGVSVHFQSDSSFISARWKLESAELGMPHMPATGVSGLDLYARNSHGAWAWIGSTYPNALDMQSVLLENAAPVAREYCLYLPLYNGTLSLEIGVADSASIAPSAPRDQQPICFYGSSIVQGGCASRPGMAYPAILGQKLDVPCLNLGFSGNAKSELEVATLLAELNPSLFVLDPLPNMTAQEVSERIGPFVETLRRQHPTTPILLLEYLHHQQSWIKPDLRKRVDEINQSLFEVWRQLEAAGIEHLHYVPFNELIGDELAGTVDGIHPTDLGFQRMATVLEPVIKPLLK